jgi:uncharacterized protein YehS (DUF1456 family)
LSEFGTLQIEFRYLDEWNRQVKHEGFRDEVEDLLSSCTNSQRQWTLSVLYENQSQQDEQQQQQQQSKKHTDGNKLVMPSRLVPWRTVSMETHVKAFGFRREELKPMYRTMYDKTYKGCTDELCAFHLRTLVS